MGSLYQSGFLITNNINGLCLTEVKEEFTGISDNCRIDRFLQESGSGNRQKPREAKQPEPQQGLAQGQPDKGAAALGSRGHL